MDAVTQMELFQNLFYVSAMIAGLGLGLAVFFFFFFDIRSVSAFVTGSAKRKTIARIEEQNSRTGRLRTMTPGQTGNTGNSAGAAVVAKAQTFTQPLSQETSPVAETSVLAQPAMEETAVLYHGQELGETAVLQTPHQEVGETAILSEKSPIRFELTENTIVIHTNEII